MDAASVNRIGRKIYRWILATILILVIATISSIITATWMFRHATTSLAHFVSSSEFYSCGTAQEYSLGAEDKTFSVALSNGTEVEAYNIETVGYGEVVEIYKFPDGKLLAVHTTPANPCPISQ